MDDSRFDELCRRVEALEREKHRWKVIGITSLTFLGLGLCLGCPLSVGTALVRTRQVQAERMEAEREREAAEEARQAEERARQAEKALQEAERRQKQADKDRGSEK